MNLMGHYWAFCPHCQLNVVYCGTCHNNTCNGGYGTIDNKPCPDCKSAYAEYDKNFLKANQNEISNSTEFNE